MWLRGVWVHGEDTLKIDGKEQVQLAPVLVLVEDNAVELAALVAVAPGPSSRVMRGCPSGSVEAAV